MARGKRKPKGVEIDRGRHEGFSVRKARGTVKVVFHQRSAFVTAANGVDIEPIKRRRVNWKAL